MVVTRKLLAIAVALAACGDAPDARLGCGADELGIRQRLELANEQPWCDRESTPREAYRFIWGHPQLPVVVSVTTVGDSAVVHGYRAEMERSGFLYRRMDTTFAMHPGAFRVYVRGDDWRPGEPSTTGFNQALWADKSEPVPAGQPGPLWALESIRGGRYHKSVRYRPSLRFRRTAHKMAEFVLANQLLYTGQDSLALFR